jgi:cbb3-type cytochrome oxidase subunit 3
MSYFIFAGDMLVMLFMFCVVVWVFAWSPKEKIDEAARIPLEDEQDNG